MQISCKLLLATVVLCVATSSPAMADPPPANAHAAAAVNAANALVREGKFDQAIEHFQQIRPPQSLVEQRNYNLAVATYRSGDTAAAKSLFAEVAAGSDASLAARSRYNLGNCFYADAVEAAEQNPQTAIAALQTAIEHYRATLHADPHHADARANIELAAKWLRELKQQEEEEEESGSQGEGEKGVEEEGVQQQGQQQGQEQGQEQQQDQQQGQGQQQEQQGQEQQQGQSGEPSSMQDEQQDGEPGEDAGEATEQGVPQGDLTAAEQPNGQDSADAASAPAQEDPNSVRMTREEALKMLQAVRDRDMLRRLQHERSERSRRQVVERDW